MEIYLLRHGHAEARDPKLYPDDDRPLTEEGRTKLAKAAKGMAKTVGRFDLIISSPLLRAKESAEIVCRLTEPTTTIEWSDLLLPGASLAELVAFLKQYRKKQHVLLVGHEPSLAFLASTLLDSPAAVIEFKKGSLCKIGEPEGLNGLPGILKWHLTSKQLRQMVNGE